MPRFLRTLTLLTALACAAVVGMGCGGRSTKPDEDVLVVLFDTSGSTTVARTRYLQDFESALSSYRERKNRIIILGDVITDNTLATAEYRINATVEENKGWFGSPLKRDTERKKALDQARNALKLNHPKSDIMTGFQLAEKVFAGHKKAKDKRLIIFSDMVEQSDRYDFSGESLDEKRINQIVAKERADHRLSDLRGVKVWCVGVGAAQKGGLSSKKIQHIQDFWMAYLRACKAEADPSHFAARLINFE